MMKSLSVSASAESSSRTGPTGSVSAVAECDSRLACSRILLTGRSARPLTTQVATPNPITSRMTPKTSTRVRPSSTSCPDSLLRASMMCQVPPGTVTGSFTTSYCRLSLIRTVFRPLSSRISRPTRSSRLSGRLETMTLPLGLTTATSWSSPGLGKARVVPWRMLDSKSAPLLVSRVWVDAATIVSTLARKANPAAETSSTAMNTAHRVMRPRIVWPRSQRTYSTSTR